VLIESVWLFFFFFFFNLKTTKRQEFYCRTILPMHRLRTVCAFEKSATVTIELTRHSKTDFVSNSSKFRDGENGRAGQADPLLQCSGV
jgi:hypothetical protein